MTHHHAICVFAVCPRGAARALDGVPGHAQAAGPVRALDAGPLTAIAQAVPLDVFGPDELPRRLSEPAVLEAFARAHHAVVETVAAAAPTVPLPLATLYHGEERARAALLADGSRLLAVLDRVAGRQEWGVKLSLAGPTPSASPSPPASPCPPPPASGPTASAAGSGRAYLDRVRGRQQARERFQRAAADAAERVHAALHRIAAASRRLRLREAEVLNAAYLLDSHRARELNDRVAALRRDAGLVEGVRIEVTGPWAPYSFAGTEAAP